MRWWEDNIKMNLKIIAVGSCGLISFSFGLGQDQGSFEHGNDFSPERLIAS
jgi:hypothetical protein